MRSQALRPDRTGGRGLLRASVLAWAAHRPLVGSTIPITGREAAAPGRPWAEPAGRRHQLRHCDHIVRARVHDPLPTPQHGGCIDDRSLGQVLCRPDPKNHCTGSITTASTTSTSTTTCQCTTLGLAAAAGLLRSAMAKAMASSIRSSTSKPSRHYFRFDSRNTGARAKVKSTTSSPVTVLMS
jgi:hypothetical protein